MFSGNRAANYSPRLIGEKEGGLGSPQRLFPPFLGGQKWGLRSKTGPGAPLGHPKAPGRQKEAVKKPMPGPAAA